MPDDRALLVSAGDVQEYARDAYSVLEDPDWPVPVIRAVQARLAAYLGYDPLVHLETQEVEHYHSYSTSDGTTLYVWAKAQPVVEVTTDDVSAHSDGVRLTADSFPASVSYYAGWRPAALTTVGQLNDLDGLDALTALPPEVPGDLATAILEAVVFIAGRVSSGAIGVTQVTQEAGSSKTITAAARLADVNRLIGRPNELVGIFDTWAHPYRIIR